MANQKQAAKAAAAAARKAAEDKQKKTYITIGIAAIVAVVLLIVGVTAFGGKDAADNTSDNTEVTYLGESAAAEIDAVATHTVTIEVADYGTITAELYGEVAPITVANFVKLANEGFYDGLTFHRIIEGFMIQGGDPNGNGTGGSDENIKGEFSLNGVANSIPHKRGVLSMARSSAYDSASSQFFIMHEQATHLDGSYAAFGCVLTGMEIVDEICARTPVTDSNGTVQKANQPVIVSIRATEIGAE